MNSSVADKVIVLGALALVAVLAIGIVTGWL
jgi:hypothetical protein